MPGPIYKEENILPKEYEILIGSLRENVTTLETKLRTTVPISKGGYRVGYGVSKIDKNIACDGLISIIKGIKSIRSW